MSGWQELGDGVWVRNYESLDLNIGVVAGGGGLAVIDTRADVTQARELRGHIAELSSRPVRWVVNTHYHWDHTFGNSEFRPAPIWGHRRCAQALADRGGEMKAGVAKWSPELAERVYAVEITPPDQTFEDRTAINLGDRTIELSFEGRGHTDSDIVVQVPDAGVVFAGDLLENGAPPYFGDGFTLDWPATLDALVPMIDGPVVPGHGPVGDRDFAITQHDEIATVAGLARARYEQGLAADRAAALGGPYPLETLQTAFARAYAQLDTRLL